MIEMYVNVVGEKLWMKNYDIIYRCPWCMHTFMNCHWEVNGEHSCNIYEYSDAKKKLFEVSGGGLVKIHEFMNEWFTEFMNDS